MFWFLNQNVHVGVILKLIRDAFDQAINCSQNYLPWSVRSANTIFCFSSTLSVAVIAHAVVENSVLRFSAFSYFVICSFSAQRGFVVDSENRSSNRNLKLARFFVLLCLARDRSRFCLSTWLIHVAQRSCEFFVFVTLKPSEDLAQCWNQLRDMWFFINRSNSLDWSV